MKIRCLVGTLVAALAPLPTMGTDKTDLWWNPEESGWGMNIAHQGDILFITFFIHGSDGQPTWYVAPATAYAGLDSEGVSTFTGPLYRVTGPYFGGAFDPSLVANAQAGSVTYRALSVTTGSVTYTVGSTTVTKSVERQRFRNNPNIYGSYLLAYSSNVSGCANPSDNGPVEETGTLRVSGTVSSTTFTVSTGAMSCTATGPYTQWGRMGRVAGTFTCPGVTGTTAVFEIEAANNVISGRFQHSYGGCREVGRFAGARRQ